MSSFKRRVQTTPLPGSRPSPYNSLPLLSTGLSSLDDLLGGGLPLSSSLLIQSDALTSYADLLLKFWVAQGLEAKQEVVVIGSGLDGDGPQGLVESLMEVDGGQVLGDEEDEEENKEAKEEKLKIAFRYEGMKQHATTVSAPTRKQLLGLLTSLPAEGADLRNPLQHQRAQRTTSTAACSTLPLQSSFVRPTELA